MNHEYPKGAVSVVNPQGTEETGTDRPAAPVYDELIVHLGLDTCIPGRVCGGTQIMREAAAALRDVIAARNADFEVYHEMFMALFNAAPDKYRSGVEMAQDIIAQRDDLQRQLGEAQARLEAAENDLNLQVKDCIAAIAEAQRRGARLEAAELALKQIMDVGHDDDCILCGFKDRRVDMYFNAARGEPT